MNKKALEHKYNFFSLSESKRLAMPLRSWYYLLECDISDHRPKISTWSYFYFEIQFPKYQKISFKAKMLGTTFLWK